MDPDEALARCLAALAEFRKAQEDDHEPHERAAAADLANSFEDLDGWLSSGGFRPKRWVVA